VEEGSDLYVCNPHLFKNRVEGEILCEEGEGERLEVDYLILNLFFR
jgi:hypothetical protein